MRLMKFALLVWNVVQRANTRAAGVVVVKFPLRNRAVIPDAAADLDHSRRAEVGPGEFLLARPDQLYRSARRSGQPRGFNGRFTGVLAAITGTGIGDNNANALFRDAKRLRQFAAHAEWPLRAGPD